MHVDAVIRARSSARRHFYFARTGRPLASGDRFRFLCSLQSLCSLDTSGVEIVDCGWGQRLQYQWGGALRRRKRGARRLGGTVLAIHCCLADLLNEKFVQLFWAYI